MSGRESPPQLGSALLAAASASLAALRAHLTDPDPKVSLRASAELTKLLGVCARHGIALEEAAGGAEQPHSAVALPEVGLDPKTSPPGPLSVPERGCSTEDRRGSDFPEQSRHPTRLHGSDSASNTPSKMERGPGGEVFGTEPMPAANRPRRRTPFHESHARPDRPPTEIARPPSAIPA